jgi:thiamine-phosphate pyrophosphorylase
MQQENPKQILRIIDANLNRIGEGLRVLEETARFVLNDAVLSEKLKNLRHQFSVRDINIKNCLLSARDSQSDVGENITTEYQKIGRSLAETVAANVRRVEESLRVMEELSKIAGISLSGQDYQEARFKLYTLEKELLGRLSRRDLSGRIKGLNVIIDTDCLKGRDILEITAQVLAGGVKLIQLRDKNSYKGELLKLALSIKKLCAENNALLIINDHLDIALACDADGLHIGQQDLPVQTARKLMPVDKLIGCSVTGAEESRKAREDGADYLGYGAVYATPTKPECPVIGIEGLKEIKRAVDLPLVAIGGINMDNITQVFAGGADAAAVISAVILFASPRQAAEEIIERIENCHEQTDRKS